MARRDHNPALDPPALCCEVKDGRRDHSDIDYVDTAARQALHEGGEEFVTAVPVVPADNSPADLLPRKCRGDGGSEQTDIIGIEIDTDDTPDIVFPEYLFRNLDCISSILETRATP
jgi:hypothetical protein